MLFFMIISFIFGLITSAVYSAILGFVSGFVLQAVTRFVAGFKLFYRMAYVVSVLSWFAAFVINSIVSLVSSKFEIIKLPGPTTHSVRYELIYPPGTIPVSTYIAMILAFIAVAVIYSRGIQDPDTGRIGLFKGFIIALVHSALFVLFVALIVGVITFMGP